MKRELQKEAKKRITRNRSNQKFRMISAALSVLVVMGTVGGLILPAQTLTRKTQVLDCQYATHTHTEACYAKDDPSNENEEKHLICGYGDYVVHQHDDNCYQDGKLVCTLPEIPEHKHTDACYQQQQVLTCGMEESAEHHHDTNCYEMVKELTCGQQELHTHTADCYDEDGQLTCGLMQLEQHQHGNACIKTVEQEEPQAEQNEPAPAETATAQPEANTNESNAPAETPAQNAQQQETPAAVAMPAQQFDGKTDGITVHAEAPEGALPEGTTMTVTKVTEKTVIDTVADAVSGKVKAVEAVDITFRNASGQEIEPAKEIRVTMTSEKIARAEESVVVHVDDKGKAEIVKQEEKQPAKNTVAFDTDAFSVYALAYTVDFEYEVDGKTYKYSMQGGTSISLQQLIVQLGIVKEDQAEKFVSEDVQNVTFSNEELVKVNHKSKILGFGKEDWELKSLKPFSSEETLTVSLKDGKAFTVKVTDAQISKQVLTADGESYTITVTYGSDAEIPDGAKLEAKELQEDSEEYEKYQKKTREVLGENGYTAVTSLRLFDIKIVVNNQEYEPKVPVQTTIRYDAPVSMEADQTVKVVHFAAEPELLTPKVEGESNPDAFTYEQSSFSVTAVAVSDSSLQSGRYILYSRDSSNGKYYALVPGDSLEAVEVQVTGNNVVYSGEEDLFWNVNVTQQNFQISYGEGGNKKYLSSDNNTDLTVSSSSKNWSKYGDALYYSVNSAPFTTYYYSLNSNNGSFSLSRSRSMYNLSGNVHFAKEKVSHIIHYGYEDENGVFYEWATEDMGLPTRIGDILDLEERAGELCDLEGYQYSTSRLNTADGVEIASLLYTDAPYYEPGSTTVRGTNYRNTGSPEDWSYEKYNSEADLSYWRYRMLSDFSEDPCNEGVDYTAYGDGYGYISSKGITKPVPFTDTEKDVYVIYKKKTTGSEGQQADSPEASKSAKANQDGTYDISLSVSGKRNENGGKANIVLILDTSWSMYQKDAEGGKRRIDATIESLNEAVDNMLALNAEDSTKVQLAFVNFAQRVRNEVSCDTIYDGTDGTALKNAIGEVRDQCAPGTNWEAALDAANRIDFGDNDPTYIVFITDGNPVSCERPYGTYSDWDGNTFKNNGGNDPRYVNAAANAANAITDSGKILYKVGAYSKDSGLDTNMEMLAGTYLGNASAQNPLSSYLDGIIEDVSAIAYKDVTVTDGITDLSSTTMISGTADSFTYTITDDLGNKAVVRVNQEGEVFGLAVNPDEGEVITEKKTTATVNVAGTGGTTGTVNGSLSYKVENTGVEDANGVEVKKITVTVKNGNTVVFEAQTTTASYSTEGTKDKVGPKAVEWSLSPLGTLESKWKYDLTFTVWPKQQAYDILADLNNGLKFYDYEAYQASLDPGETALSEDEAISQGLVLTEDIQKQIIKENDGYAVRTNTYASLSYKKVQDGQTSDAQNSEITDPKQTMGLDESKVKVRKAWDVSLDPSQLTRFLQENPDYKVQLAVKNPDGNSVPVTIEPAPVTQQPDGTYISQNTKDVYIAPGVMLSESKAIEKGVDLTKYRELEYKGTTYYLLETGHNYTMDEFGSDWHFELDAQVYHPMVVDGTERDVSFTLDGQGQITGITAIDTDNDAVLTATNKLRSGLNIVKKVYDTDNNEITTDDSTFYVKLTLKDKDGTEIKYSDYLMKEDYPVGTILSKENIDGRYWLIKAQSGDKTYTYYSLNEDGSDQIDQHAYPIWYNEYDAYSESEGKIDGVGNWTIDGIWESGEVKEIKPGQLLRLKNIPYGTQITLTEVTPTRNANGEITGYQDVAVGGKTDGYKLIGIEGNGVTADFNESYNTIVKNQLTEQEISFRKADIKYINVTDESQFQTLDGALFELYKGSSKLYVNTSGKVMTQEEVETIIEMPVTDSGAKTAMESAGITDRFALCNNGNPRKLTIPEGTYKLKEVATPDGYVDLAGTIEFTVGKNQVTESSDYMDVRTVNEELMVTVYNVPGAALPNTGGIGTTIFYVIGSILAIGAGVLLVTKKRMGGK